MAFMAVWTIITGGKNTSLGNNIPKGHKPLLEGILQSLQGKKDSAQN
jgi:hypothetical protein